ncbi:hypothetical protein KVR01_004177 [Diaporthe batatas]|uniref:uncharacterized protein n=1 Tax=Diaporthe batatas TaxID=748121 RepID=UPI001D04E984|nr:uncharacterized protein KVR01_004177 [Diaporthe batatas]KAG8165625.1 hypothetical protein KVR01_004177 [Diaporthe batatas]
MAPGPSFWTVLTHFFPPKPRFTEKDVPDLTGKVCVVTGSNTGIGKDVARFLYMKNAKVYVACRSEEKALKAIESVRTEPACARSTGELVFLPLDLADLPSTKAAAENLIAKEEKIHLLFNNAGVMVGTGEPIPRTNQGYELSLGVNCLAPFLFTQLLTPTLAATAKTEPPNTVRVVWVSSFGLNLSASEDVGVSLVNLDYHRPQPNTERYGLVVSVPIDPGNLRTELPRDQSIVIKIMVAVLCYPVVNGAYTELFAAFSPDVTVDSDWSQEWVIPWGRFRALRPDLLNATKSAAEGGTGGVRKFWDWCEEQVKAYL